MSQAGPWDAYELAQSSECSADPRYRQTLMQWHETVQAMSLAMETMPAGRLAAVTSAPPTDPKAAPPVTGALEC